MPPDLVPIGQAVAPDLGQLAEAWASCVQNRGNLLREQLRGLFKTLGFTDPSMGYARRGFPNDLESTARRAERPDYRTLSWRHRHVDWPKAR